MASGVKDSRGNGRAEVHPTLLLTPVGLAEIDEALACLSDDELDALVEGAGGPECVAMERSGHRTRAVFDRYNIVSEDDLRTAQQKVGLRYAEANEEAR